MRLPLWLQKEQGESQEAFRPEERKQRHMSSEHIDASNEAEETEA